MSASVPAKSDQLRPLRILAGVLLAVPVVMLIIMWFALRDSLTEPTPWAWVIGVLVLAVVGHGILRATGYHATALARGTDKKSAMEQSKLSYQTALFRRVMTAQLPMLVAMTLSFTVGGGFYLVLFGCAASLNLLVLHVWPSARSVERVKKSLEAAGGRSYLREALGLPPD